MHIFWSIYLAHRCFKLMTLTMFQKFCASLLLQRAVESLESWFRLWRIDVSPDKSSAILFTQRRHRPAGEIVMFERPIPWKTEVRYLGITFDNHLRFNAQLDHGKTRAQMVRKQFNSLINRRSKMSIKNKITMYSSAVWGNVSNMQLQKLQVVQNTRTHSCANPSIMTRMPSGIIDQSVCSSNRTEAPIPPVPHRDGDVSPPPIRPRTFRPQRMILLH
jgi:hypothetical protein